MAATDYDFILTRNELIAEAYRKCGILADGQPISSSQLQNGSRKLNLIIKALSGKGIFLFSMDSDELAITTDEVSVDFPTDNGIQYIDSMRVVQDGGTTTEFSLERIPYEEYQGLSQKDIKGRPTAYAQDRAKNLLFFYPTPDQDYTIKYTGYTRLKDWEDADSSGEFPVEWFNCLKYMVAVEIAEDLRLELSQVQHLIRRSGEAFREAKAGEIDNSDTPYMKGSY